eukprot:350219-Chlamydomonas_euryale.AAC.2
MASKPKVPHHAIVADVRLAERAERARARLGEPKRTGRGAACRRRRRRSSQQRWRGLGERGEQAVRRGADHAAEAKKRRGGHAEGVDAGGQ